MTPEIMRVMPEDPIASGYKTTALIRKVRNLENHRDEEQEMLLYYAEKLALIKEVIACYPNFIPVIWDCVRRANVLQLKHHF